MQYFTSNYLQMDGNAIAPEQGMQVLHVDADPILLVPFAESVRQDGKGPSVKYWRVWLLEPELSGDRIGVGAIRTGPLPAKAPSQVHTQQVAG